MGLLKDKVFRDFFIMWSMIAAALVLIFTTGCGEVSVKRSAWQAVFLTTGQVYYGKLTDRRGQFYRLKNVYYLRRQVPAETEEGEEAPQAQLTLVRMGSEIHAPEDEMKINRDHILYIANLQPQGPLSLRIEQAELAAVQPWRPVADADESAEEGAPSTEPEASTLPGDQLTPEEMEQFRKFQEFQQKQKN